MIYDDDDFDDEDDDYYQNSSWMVPCSFLTTWTIGRERKMVIIILVHSHQ